jgi:hypothetical protein
MSVGLNLITFRYVKAGVNMRHFPSKLIALGMALALGILPDFNIVTAQQPALPTPAQQYTVNDLTPAGSTTSTAAAISGAQQVGGAGFTATTAAGQPVVIHAMLWNGGAASAIDLGAGTATAVDAVAQVGSANNHAALWRGTAASRVDLNPARWEQSVASGIGGGRQVGSATRQVLCTAKKGKCLDGTKIEIHPFMWAGSADTAVDLTPLVLGFGAGRALGTDGVQQVGYGQQVIGNNAFSGAFAVLWTGTADSAINLNPPDSIESQARAVAGGQQVGFGYYPHRALLWSSSAESVVDLHPAGYTSSEANATNGIQQAGTGFIGDVDAPTVQSHALVWSGSAASVIDLNQFLPPGYTDAAATGIDASGTVVGWASKGPRDNPANVHAVMWIPGTSGATFAQSLALSQPTVVAGNGVQATVRLSLPAPEGGANVTLTNAIIQPSGATGATPLSVEIPPYVLVEAGQRSASFNVNTAVTTLDGFNRAYLVDLQAAYGGSATNATLAVNPPLYLSSLAVAPATIAGGNSAVATLALSGAAPTGGALVTLASDNPAAVVPANVLVPAGQTGTTVVVRTNAVTTSTPVKLTATYGNLISTTGTTTLIVTPPPVQTDTVAIQRAEYIVSKRQLAVQATSTSQTARLTVSVTATGQVIGILSNRGGGRYDGTFNLTTNPQNVTVISSLNGRASRAVTAK